MTWQDTLRTITEEIIKNIEHENRILWGNPKDNEDDIDLMFPTYMPYKILINGKEHHIDAYFILDKQLPRALKYID